MLDPVCCERAVFKKVNVYMSLLFDGTDRLHSTLSLISVNCAEVSFPLRQ